MPKVVAPSLESAVWADAEGRATAEQKALLASDEASWIRELERLLDETETSLAAVRRMKGSEREQALADLQADLDRLDTVYFRLVPEAEDAEFDDDEEAAEEADGNGAEPHTADSEPGQPKSRRANPFGPKIEPRPGVVQLQASWWAGNVVVWAAGPGTRPATNDELAQRLEAAGGPPHGWSTHPGVPMRNGSKATALAIPVHDALGWLVSAGGPRAAADEGTNEVGASVTWLGRVAVAAVRLVARGSIVPRIHTRKRSEIKQTELSVRWVPALADPKTIEALAATMPGPIVALGRAEPRTITMEILGSIVDAIAKDAARRVELPAPPPVTRTPQSVAEAIVTRLNGSTFLAPSGAAGEIVRRMERWSKPVAGSARTRLVVQLDPPDEGNAWDLAVLGPGADGTLLPVEVALADSKATAALADELVRLERAYPPLLRPGGLRRGQVVLSQDEAWKLMTEVGSSLEAAGFLVRVPQLSRRRPRPSLRLFSEAGDTVVGANQLANVRWSAVFDDVELTAAEISKLAAEARPLVKSRGRWIELDRADLRQAAEALAERSKKTKMSGAEVLRHAIGLEGSPLAGGLSVEGSGWAAELLERAKDVQGTEAVASPPGFVGELRSYQAEALGWLAFLDAVELGGCLALDMGLGKTPTVLAHLGRTTGKGTALVVAPPAVVGNWAAEAGRFAPDLRVVVHHGATRSSAEELEAEIVGADLVITTYGTAVRDIEALSTHQWERLILDEAQAIKNPANETSQQLRRIPARSKIALTGTPIENGLGDLWSILDFTNPGLVGSRPSFIAQLSGEGERALRALNGILVFRRTKSEPEVAAELPDRIDELDHCTMTPEQIGLYQAVLDGLVSGVDGSKLSASRERSSRRSPRSSRSATTRPPTSSVRTPIPTTEVARRTVGQARPARGDRRERVRRRRTGSGVHPLRRVGQGARRTPHRTHRSPDLLLPRRPGTRCP